MTFIPTSNMASPMVDINMINCRNVRKHAATGYAENQPSILDQNKDSQPNLDTKKL